MQLDDSGTTPLAICPNAELPKLFLCVKLQFKMHLEEK